MNPQATTQIAFTVVPYVQGSRGGLKPGDIIQCRNRETAELRAEKLMASGRVLGVDVVCEAAHPALDEYGEAEYLVRPGRVPQRGCPARSAEVDRPLTKYILHNLRPGCGGGGSPKVCH